MQIGPELVITVFGLLLTAIGSLLIYIFSKLDKKVGHIDCRIDALDAKFDKMRKENDDDHAAVISRLDKIETRLESSKEDIEYVYTKLDKHQSLIDQFMKYIA